MERIFFHIGFADYSMIYLSRIDVNVMSTQTYLEGEGEGVREKGYSHPHHDSLNDEREWFIKASKHLKNIFPSFHQLLKWISHSRDILFLHVDILAVRRKQILDKLAT